MEDSFKEKLIKLATSQYCGIKTHNFATLQYKECRAQIVLSCEVAL